MDVPAGGLHAHLRVQVVLAVDADDVRFLLIQHLAPVVDDARTESAFRGVFEQGRGRILRASGGDGGELDSEYFVQTFEDIAGMPPHADHAQFHGVAPVLRSFQHFFNVSRRGKKSTCFSGIVVVFCGKMLDKHGK